MSTELDQWMQACRERIELAMEKRLTTGSPHPERLHKAIEYSTSNGGKRFRPLLIYATAEALNIPLERVDTVAVAIEWLHAYSLVHDDLPAMDDDDLRRGKPTCHIAFDEATAILAGDALQAMAFQILAQELSSQIPAEQRLKIIERIADAVGPHGMVGGQAIDLEAEGRNLNAAELESMHIRKTGALIRASVLGAAHCAAQLEQPQIEALDHYAKCVGLAFQIHDDVLDETGTDEELGKTAGADRARSKSTYPALFGLAESRQMADQLIKDAQEQLLQFGENAQRLSDLAGFVVDRHG